MINIYSDLVFRLVHICKIVLHLIEILACFFPHQLILFFSFQQQLLLREPLSTGSPHLIQVLC